MTRNVLPAIIPAWSAAGHHCCKYSDYRNAEPLRAPAVVVALPDYETSGSALLTLSVQTEPAAEVVFPNAFNANGLCSVSGE